MAPLPTPDLEASIAWYQRVLALDLRSRGAGRAILGRGEEGLVLVQGLPRPGAITRLAYSSDDWPTVAIRAQGAGGEVVESVREPADDPSLAARLRLRDPWGNTIEAVVRREVPREPDPELLSRYGPAVPREIRPALTRLLTPGVEVAWLPPEEVDLVPASAEIDLASPEEAEEIEAREEHGLRVGELADGGRLLVDARAPEQLWVDLTGDAQPLFWIPCKLEALARLLALHQGERKGQPQRRWLYLGLLDDLEVLDSHLAESPWLSQGEEDPTPPPPGMVRRAATARFSGARMVLLWDRRISIDDFSPLALEVGWVPDPFAPPVISTLARLRGSHPPRDLPVDVAAALWPTDLLGIDDLRLLLKRCGDPMDHARSSLPVAWAFLMAHVPGNPEAGLEILVKDPAASVRFAAAVLARAFGFERIAQRACTLEPVPEVREAMRAELEG